MTPEPYCRRVSVSDRSWLPYLAVAGATAAVVGVLSGVVWWALGASGAAWFGPTVAVVLFGAAAYGRSEIVWLLDLMRRA